MTEDLTGMGGNPDLKHLFEHLREVLKTEQAIKDYLDHPNPSFDGEAPRALVKRGEFERVAADLRALREGVYL